MKKYLGVAFMVLCAGVLSSQPSWREQVGRQPDGSFIVSSGWRIKPAGKQFPLDTLPMSTALSKDGKYLLVLNGGYRPPSIIVLSTADMHEVSRVPVPDAWLGLAVSPNGKNVYASGRIARSGVRIHFRSQAVSSPPAANWSSCLKRSGSGRISSATWRFPLMAA